MKPFIIVTSTKICNIKMISLNKLSKIMSTIKYTLVHKDAH